MSSRSGQILAPSKQLPICSWPREFQQYELAYPHSSVQVWERTGEQEGMGVCSPSAADPAPAVLQPRTPPGRFHHPRHPVKGMHILFPKWHLEGTDSDSPEGKIFLMLSPPHTLLSLRLVAGVTFQDSLGSHNHLLSQHLSSYSPAVLSSLALIYL